MTKFQDMKEELKKKKIKKPSKIKLANYNK